MADNMGAGVYIRVIPFNNDFNLIIEFAVCISNTDICRSNVCLKIPRFTKSRCSIELLSGPLHKSWGPFISCLLRSIS